MTASLGTKRFLSAEHHGEESVSKNDNLKFLGCQDGVTYAQLVFCPQIAWEGSAKLSAASQTFFAAI
jgi:hypothetical protein